MYKRISVLGQVYNQWTVINSHAERRGTRWYHLCRCVCGAEKLVKAASLASNYTKNCGCLLKKSCTGNVHGRLIVIKSHVERRGYKWHHLCLCECGNEKLIDASTLTTGGTTSCGCLQKEETSKRSTIHGMSGTSTHSTWKGMKSRCYNKNEPAYVNYGGRGITICDRWLNSFENFYADMGEKPSQKYSIDRINNDGNYEPSNCRWATAQQQVRNQRVKKQSASGVRGVRLMYNGKYMPFITHNGSIKYLGIRGTLEEAKAIRKSAEAKYWT